MFNNVTMDWINKTYPKYVLFLLLLGLWACQEESLIYPKAYAAWVENPAHGLRQVKTIRPYQFVVQYKPLDYIIAMEERQERLPLPQVEQRRKELGEDLEYFNFRIAPSAGKQSVLMQAADNEQAYYQLIDYFSYAAKDDFYLLAGTDTAQCQLYSFVRNYELSPHLDFVMAFEKTGSGDKTFVFEDQVLQTGPIRATIQQQKIDQLPTLKTN